MIRAKVHTDDQRFAIEFDATKYFEQAPDDAIFDLARADWGGDYPADWVAEYFEYKNPDIKNMFRYLRDLDVRARRDPPGFEVYVNEEDAIEWLKGHRPLIARAIQGRWKGIGPRDWQPPKK